MKEVEICIGIPVLNGAKFLEKRLDSILSQTFSNFEIIISNNASTDNTLLICEKYAQKDSRIKIFNQNETINVEKNFAFVLQHAKSKYFVWASADDLWKETFLEKNFKFLEKNPNYICCSGKVKRFGDEVRFEINSNDSLFIKSYKKFRSCFRPFYNLSFTGSYTEKASNCLRHNNILFLFGLFRTEIIKKCVIDYQVHSSDLIMCLRALEFGDVNIIDEVLWYFYSGGLSSKGTWKNFSANYTSFFEVFFPFIPLTIWCKNHFRMKFIIKNLAHFIWLNSILGFTPLFLDIFKKFNLNINK
jgi:glycosyltransferase involved in cell wall biosynthesis